MPLTEKTVDVTNVRIFAYKDVNGLFDIRNSGEDESRQRKVRVYSYSPSAGHTWDELHLLHRFC